MFNSCRSTGVERRQNVRKLSIDTTLLVTHVAVVAHSRGECSEIDSQWYIAEGTLGVGVQKMGVARRLTSLGYLREVQTKTVWRHHHATKGWGSRASRGSGSGGFLAQLLSVTS